MPKANKGEWSEFYAFLTIITERKLFAADKNLDIIPEKYFVFHRIIREEKQGKKIIYDLEGPKNQVRILDDEENILAVIENIALAEKVQNIFESIKNSKK